ncbi:DUF1064 domain-containing protein [Christensenellaceae bacterium OttesenSCG-928-K19]|nr:DUF1064 domain-containing protein [Christensenellaceae bacterium OttesenSCG-928-K19]
MPIDPKDTMTAEEFQEYMRSGKMPAHCMQTELKRSKYGNKRTTLDGVERDSKLESDYYAQLRLMEKAKEVTRFFEKVSFQLTDGISYVADFVVLWPDGTWTVEDTKGKETDVYKMKKKLMKELKGIEIKEVRREDL